MKDFKKSTIAKLKAKGILICGTQAAPAFEGDKFFGGRNYCLDDNGRGIVRSLSEVLEMAK